VKRYTVRWAPSDFGGGDWQVYDTRDGLVTAEMPVPYGTSPVIVEQIRAFVAQYVSMVNELEDARVRS
jgi:hypothetical protein